MAVLAMACKEEESRVGGTLRPSDVIRTDTIDDIQAFSIAEDSIRTSKMSAEVFGWVEDPLFGTVRSHLFIQFRLSADAVNFGTDAELEARIENAAGMPVSDYLSQYGPRLVPTADALKSRYEGSGSYQIDGVHLRFEGLDDARYLADDALLVLEFVDRTEVYRRA